MSNGQPEMVQVPHELARKNEVLIKETVNKKFGVQPEALSLLLEASDGVYFSEEESDTLCCLVVDNKGGLLYLVSGKMDPDKKEMRDFKCDILA